MEACNVKKNDGNVEFSIENGKIETVTSNLSLTYLTSTVKTGSNGGSNRVKWGHSIPYHHQQSPPTQWSFFHEKANKFYKSYKYFMARTLSKLFCQICLFLYHLKNVTSKVSDTGKDKINNFFRWKNNENDTSFRKFWINFFE